MKKTSNTYYKNRHACFLLEYHLVLTTKYGKPILVDDVDLFVKNYANQYFSNNNCNILEIESNEDCVHILFEAPVIIQLTKFINGFKTVSSRMVRKRFIEILNKYYCKPYFWSKNYFITTVGENRTNVIRDYIETQKE